MDKKSIQRIIRIVFVFMLIGAVYAGNSFETRALAAEPPASDGWNVLVDDNFENDPLGTHAEDHGYVVDKPMLEEGNAGNLKGDAYVAKAPGKSGNSLYVYDDFNSVSNVAYRNNTRIVKTFEKQEGVVVAEVSFMQPGPQRERTKVLNLLSSSGDYIARITADPGQGKFVFDAKTGPDNMYPYEPNRWYNIKLVVDIVNDQVMVYVDGNLSFSKQPTVEVRSAGTTTSEKIKQNVAKLEMLTAGGSPNPVNAFYISHIKVSAKPPAVSPEAPVGLSAYPRDKEIYVEWAPSASARSNNVYVATKPDAADSEYVKVIDKYNKKFVPSDYVSITKLGTASGSPPLENGKTYYVKITQNTRLLSKGTDTEIESPLSLSQAVAVTPSPRKTLDSTPTSVIQNVYVNDTKNMTGWSVQSGLSEGSVPYGDSQSTITKMPASYLGADWLRTSNASGAYTASDVLTTFTVTDDTDVIVAVSREAMEDNISWLSSWTKTGDTIELDGGTAVFHLYKRSFAANSQVTLSKIGQSDCNGYFVLVRSRSIQLNSFEFVDDSGHKLSTLTPGINATAKVEVTNNTAEDQSFVVICALYDTSNHLITYTSASVKTRSGEQRTLNTGFKVPQTISGYQAKAFIWDSFKNMKPLSNSISIQ
ncbi:hypothetical protein [Paenibacillus aceris]|uniref:Fibronectin type-III domain-containing protein n=1 Tax=Paenibacillus aceris TaxID=869555 RepID=A0ABS4HW18_9BACL|nr:hypothetical protein [Paenibacillus aceris]MBP1962837.1 hypothetical protein [Paenibacillus aceris]NHW38265.1 hypothetical protein [Paenibacillus aceris]